MKSLGNILLLLLTAVLMITLFAACGKDDTTAPTTTVPTPTTSTPTIATTTAKPPVTTAKPPVTTTKPPVTTTKPPITSDLPSSTPAVPVTTVTPPTVTTPPENIHVDLPICATHTPSKNGSYCTVCYTVIESDIKEYKDMVYFASDSKTLTEAYKVAFADITGNIKPYDAGVLTERLPCLMAGADYDTPWTRDAAINVYNAFALMNPEVSKNTLLSVLKKTGSQYQIDGQYWDAIIWAIGAYRYITVTHDEAFAAIAQNAITNSLRRFEREEFDAEDGLFRGGAVYGDGVAAYPDKYANGPNSGLEGWLENPDNKDQIVNAGRGIPMKALSTNCCYYEAYVILAKLNAMLGKDTAAPLKKAEALKAAINKGFWNEEKGNYDYLAYECDYQEAIGLGLVLLFGIADDRQAALVLQNTRVTEQGIAIVWPSFDRYLTLGGYGRHAGVIWPHGQAFWARACSKYDYKYGYEYELFLMAEKAVRDGQFYEIYHPDNGEPYGGLQEFNPSNISSWGSCSHQTWSATGYLSLIYFDLLGTDIGEKSVTFTPYLPEGVNEATFSGLTIGKATFDIVITRGNGLSAVTFDTTVEGNYRLHLEVQ